MIKKRRTKPILEKERELHACLTHETKKRNRSDRRALSFTTNAAADALIKDIKHYSHANLIALLMNKGMPFGRSFDIPYWLKRRKGGFSFRRLRKLSKAEIN